MERLSDSCMLQLIRTSFSTFLVDNIQILQLKAISLICTVSISYFYMVLSMAWILSPYSQLSLFNFSMSDDRCLVHIHNIETL